MKQRITKFREEKKDANIQAILLQLGLYSTLLDLQCILGFVDLPCKLFVLA